MKSLCCITLVLAAAYGAPVFALDLSSFMPKIPENGTIGDILIWVIALNLALSGLSKALEKVKDKTKTDTDNKIHAKLNKVSGFLQKVIDFSSANVAHKK